MIPLLESARTALTVVVSALGPTAVATLIGAAAGGAGAAVVVLLLRAVVRAWRRRTVRVSSLAARGESRAEIARRVGISQDAVGMLLHAGAGRRARRNLPLPARIAAPRGHQSHHTARDLKLELFAARGVSPGPSGRWEAAQALPFPAATTRRRTRSGRMA